LGNKIKAGMIVAAIIILYLVFRFITGPDVYKTSSSAIDPSVAPLQTILENPETVDIKFKDGQAVLTLTVKYKVAAKVCGTQKYSRPWSSYVAPYDFCLMWGKLAVDDIDDFVTFSQDMRWYQYKYKLDGPYDGSYIARHSANTHLIYATRNIRKAASRIAKGDIIELEGYLVKLSGAFKGQKIWWNSSMSRDDTGRGSCEVLYVESLKKGAKVYR